MAGPIHLVDTLLKRGVKIVKIFGPEHGFRGTADAGEKVTNTTDTRTGFTHHLALWKKENLLKMILKTLT